ncbi:hypothetical protein SIL73_13135 [Acidithiobacillus thiooxidans]|uniref:hypothetical protein n=1 Tax=Acidithiobacillus thiooxidans TaxID=930 RepID=UPI0029C3601B|nr:hypothetical protein [Acidithiobacillus thiooxidans]MDX5935634.1 hypothetical protein [Acidithiobacillus thiooxidans]
MTVITDDEYKKLLADHQDYLARIEKRAARIRKPVVEVSYEDMWNYKFQAKRYVNDRVVEIIASNSLTNLKNGVKDRGWNIGWLTTTRGCFSFGQDVVDEYPYCPKYRYLKSRRRTG